MSVAIVKHRLMDIELVARHTLTKLLAWAVMGLPFVIGIIMGHILSSRPAFLYDRAPWDLLVVALNYVGINAPAQTTRTRKRRWPGRTSTFSLSITTPSPLT